MSQRVAVSIVYVAAQLPELDVYRVLQGAGGGLMTPVGLAMLFRVFGPDERIRVAAILAVLAAGAALSIRYRAPVASVQEPPGS